MLHLFCPPSGSELATVFVSPIEGRPRWDNRREHSRLVELRTGGWRAALLLAISPLLAIALSGCSGAAISGVASGGLQISPGNLSFGSVSVGNTATANISVVNLGAAPVEISGLNVTGKSFFVNGQSNLPVTVAGAGGTYNVTVEFNPSVSGTATGQLTVTSDSTTNGITTIGLSGTGLTPAPTSPPLSALTCSYAVTGPGTDPCSVSLTAAAPSGGATVNLASSNPAVAVPASVTVAAGATSASFNASISTVPASQAVTLTASTGGVTENFDIEVEVATPALSLSAASLAFGNEAVNTPTTQTLTLTSTGAAATTITSATLTGTGFSVSGATFPVTLTPGQSTTLTVQFDPSAAGAATGQITVASDASGGSSTVIPLSGTGVPVLTAFSCTTSSYTGSGTDACTVTVNTAAASGGFAVSLSSNDAAVTVPSSVTVAAGASSASFSATVSSVTTAQTATLSANSGGTPLTFALQLKAAVPTLTVGTSSLSFGSVSVNTATTQTVSLSSTGTGSVTISSATISGLGFSISGATFPLTIGANQSTSLTIQFDPSTAGAASGQLTLVSNSSTGTSTTITLSGTGVPVLTALSCTNSSMTGSGTDACTVTLNAAATTGGFTVGLSSNNSAVTVPSSVTVASGSASASFSATVSSVSTAQAVTLSANAGTVSKTFALQLNAAVATLSINATSIAFGSVNTNSPSTQTVTLTSTGALSVTVSSATISGTGFSVSGATFPVTLSQNQTVTLSVVFDPTAVGAATGELTIVSTSLTNPTDVISLTGTGTAALYEVNLSWYTPTSSSDPVYGYNIYRSPSGSSTYVLMGSLSTSPELPASSELTYTDTNNIVDGQTYDYIVESVDVSGNESVPSNMAPVTIPN
jgi:hypothetical protein